MKKLLTTLIIGIYLFTTYIPLSVALDTNNQASPWTREKAMHLARSVLFQASWQMVDTLYNAGSASAAVDILFPSLSWPDRTQYDSFIANYTSSGFNWWDANHTIRLYQIMYATDPYEAKRKLFSLFEDIFAVNNDNWKDITYRDISDSHTLIYDNMFGNYQSLVKKMLYNNGGRWDYAEGAFLDLFNQNDPKQPNENYARELLQLFLMGEYEPWKSKDNNDIRNYEESDVRSLAKILTGLRADKLTHAITFDSQYYYSGAVLEFLSGSYSGMPPAYYDTLSWVITPSLILQPTNGNNGLTDNVIEYIFAKRSDQIALFLADRLARFYMQDTPSLNDIDMIASVIKSNNFDIYTSVKMILSMDIMYSEASMNSVRYKTPLDLAIGTLRLLRENNFSALVGDINLYDTNLLRRLGWTPYFAGSVFGRDGFDNSRKWLSTSTQAAWMNATNYFTYRTTGTGIIDFYSTLPIGKYKEITTEKIDIITSQSSSFTWSMEIVSGSIEVVPLVSTIKTASLRAFSLEASDVSLEPWYSTEEQIMQNGFSLDPIVSIEWWENLVMTPPDDFLFAPTISEIFFSAPGVISDFVEIVVNPATKTFSAIIDDTSSWATSPSSIPVWDATGDVLSSSWVPIFIADTGGSLWTGEVLFIESGSISIVSSGATTTSATGNSLILTGSTDSGTSLTSQPVGEILSGVVSDVLTDIVEADSGTTTVSRIADIIDIAALDAPLGSGMVINTGNVIFPQFRIVIPEGIIFISGWTYDGITKTLSIKSWIFQSNTGAQSAIASWSLMASPTSTLFADTVTPDEIIDAYELLIFWEKRLSPDVRILLSDFLTQDAFGASMLVAPSNALYFNTYIRWVISIMLSQPEYVMLHGYDAPVSIDTNQTNLLDSVTGKLLFIELYGWNDYLSSIIPKDEYLTYLDYRTNSTGSIAMSGSELVDIGDNYMNVNLAYGSGWSPGFKDLYDQWYLKLFNRVWWYKHSNDHDAAAKQITSYDSSTSLSAEWAFGHLVKNELESTHTISLWAKLPNIYRAGRYVNLGWNVILSNPLNGWWQWTRHMTVMQDITLSRAYPADTARLFRDTGKISEIWKTSVSQWGAPGASGNMNSVLDFTKVLMNNNIGRTFYMWWAGWYDTHGNQRIWLNTNLRTVSSAVTTFFNSVKDTQDITIVIFSEFGRTNRTNGDLGTDHGDGGGMYVLTSNTQLRNELWLGSYGNMSIKNAKNNALGIGIDYRSVYGTIFKNLYNLNPSAYFDAHIDLIRDTSMAPNKINLLSYSYQLSWQNVLLNTEFSVTGVNFDPGKAGYTRLWTNTGTAIDKITRLREGNTIKPEGYTYTFSINPITQPFYTIETFSNQYASTSFVWAHTGEEIPAIIPNTSRLISQEKNSILSVFSNVNAPSKLSGSGIIIESTGSNILPLPNAGNTNLHFQSGVTSVTDITYISGSIAWRWWFILGDEVDASLFFPDTARMISDNAHIPAENIARIIKIGADRRWVGMQLNQAIGIEFWWLKTGESYRIITSEDGIIWSDIELLEKNYIADASGSIMAYTNHFSYFALLWSGAILTPPPLPLPSCSISANPPNIINGSWTLLNWAIQNASTGVINPWNVLVSSSGSFAFIPPINASTNYILSVTNTTGISACSVVVTASPVVVPPPTVLPPTCIISTNSGSIQNGSWVTLAWSLQNTSTGILTPFGTIIDATGTLSIIPPSSTTTFYSIAVSNTAGSATCNTQVTASASTVPIPPIPPVPVMPISLPILMWPGGWGASSSPATPLNTNSWNTLYLEQSIIGASDSMPASPIERYISAITDIAYANDQKFSTSYSVGLAGRLWQSIRDFQWDKESYKWQILAALRWEIEQNKAVSNTNWLDRVIAFIVRVDTKNIDQYNTNIDTIELWNSLEVIKESMNNTRYIAAENSVYLRTTPVVSNLNILRSLSRNMPVRVLWEEGSWSLVDDGNGEWYIRTSLLRNHIRADDIRSGAVPLTTVVDAKVIAPQSVYLRESPDISSRIISVLFRDEGVVILDSVGKWFEVMTEKYRGFVSKKYIRVLTAR